MHQFILNILITHRLTQLLVNEEGPFDIFVWIRDSAGVELDEFSRCTGSNVFAKGLCCYLCTSVWTGFLVAIVRKEPILNGLGYSAGAIILRAGLNKYG